MKLWPINEWILSNMLELILLAVCVGLVIRIIMWKD